MAMSAGTKPTSWDSPLTDLAGKIYTQLCNSGYFNPKQYTFTYEVYKSASAKETKTSKERDEDYHSRVFKDKQFSYYLANSIITEITTNGSVVGGQVVTVYKAGVGSSGEELVAGTYPCVGTVMTPSLSPLKLN